jgi:hypothetical protein
MMLSSKLIASRGQIPPHFERGCGRAAIVERLYRQSANDRKPIAVDSEFALRQALAQ